jgi:hypothetical protein
MKTWSSATYTSGMDDERELPGDPAKLLPFECVLEPTDESVEKLPFEFQGSGDDLYTGTVVF